MIIIAAGIVAIALTGMSTASMAEAVPVPVSTASPRGRARCARWRTATGSPFTTEESAS